MPDTPYCKVSIMFRTRMLGNDLFSGTHAQLAQFEKIDRVNVSDDFRLGNSG